MASEIEFGLTFVLLRPFFLGFNFRAFTAESRLAAGGAIGKVLVEPPTQVPLAFLDGH